MDEHWEKALKEALQEDALERAPLDGLHLSEETLLDFIDDHLDDEGLDVTRDHLSSCHLCMERLEEMQKMRVQLSSQSEKKIPKRSFPHWMTMAAGLFLGGLLVTLFIPKTPDASHAEQDLHIVQFSPFQERGPVKVELDDREKAVLIQWELDTSKTYEDYRIRWYDSDGKLLKIFPSLMVRGGMVNISVLKADLQENQNRFDLEGLEQQQWKLLASQELEHR